MSAPVDVLAVMDAEIRDLPGMAMSIEFAGAKYGWKCDVKEAIRRLSEARAAVAELIAADTEYDAAHSAWVSGPYVTHAQYERLQAAKVRRAAALARVKGEGP